ncbi:hypothetical protein IHE44_0005535 [Lamprotornis superbus]|uniref:Uncharacterized protein n=1 Tax=Lamprotornis superbus TaxID=245042 RepID=A0A835P0J7_9PASS|nr:hypothetical protein IHE44_0005535 [Lamprotornis superbus]
MAQHDSTGRLHNFCLEIFRGRLDISMIPDLMLETDPLQWAQVAPEDCSHPARGVTKGAQRASLDQTPYSRCMESGRRNCRVPECLDLTCSKKDYLYMFFLLHVTCVLWTWKSHNLSLEDK